MAQFRTKTVSALAKVDPVWARIRSEAEEVVRREPEIASFIYAAVLHHDTLEAAVVHRIAANFGGTASAEGTPGLGSRFVVRLPEAVFEGLIPRPGVPTGA